MTVQISSTAVNKSRRVKPFILGYKQSQYKYITPHSLRDNSRENLVLWSLNMSITSKFRPVVKLYTSPLQVFSLKH